MSKIIIPYPQNMNDKKVKSFRLLPAKEPMSFMTENHIRRNFLDVKGKAVETQIHWHIKGYILNIDI